MNEFEKSSFKELKKNKFEVFFSFFLIKRITIIFYKRAKALEKTFSVYTWPQKNFDLP
jgi:hypothetical protein